MRFEDGFWKQVQHVTDWFTRHIQSQEFKAVYGDLALCKQERLPKVKKEEKKEEKKAEKPK